MKMRKFANILIPVILITLFLVNCRESEPKRVDDIKSKNEIEMSNPNDNCESEIDYLNKEIQLIRKEVKDLKNTCSAYRPDDINQGRYLKNWNANRMESRRINKARTFNCLNDFDFQVLLTDVMSLSGAYASNSKKNIIFFSKEVDEGLIKVQSQISNTGKASKKNEKKVDVINDNSVSGNSSNEIDTHLGLWTDHSSSAGGIYRMRNDKVEGLVFELVDHNRGFLPSRIKKSKKNGKVMYKEIDGLNGGYFIQESNGDLSVYDETGFILTYTKIK